MTEESQKNLNDLLDGKCPPYAMNKHAKYFLGGVPPCHCPELLAILKELEWCMDYDECCPVCYSSGREEKVHSPDCRLAALLKKAEDAGFTLTNPTVNHDPPDPLTLNLSPDSLKALAFIKSHPGAFFLDIANHLLIPLDDAVDLTNHLVFAGLVKRPPPHP